MNLVSGRSVHSTANSEACFDLAEKWLKNCLSNHTSSCPYDAVTSLPTRVLDVGPDPDSNQVRAFETKGQKGSWVALSHCWGRIARFVTETATLQQRTEGIALSELPETFLDAVIITRKLGYRYLWIDSLCILQDSRQDWMVESRRMQEYYSGSVLTIASDLASGDHESFLDHRRSPTKWLKIPFSTKTTAKSSHVYIFRDVKAQGADLDPTPLNIRGWTLQEDILSPRTLHYTTAELVFECQRCRYAETDATPQGYTDSEAMGSIKRFFLKPESGLEDPLLLRYPHFMSYYEAMPRWYRLFENYCTRLLTFESDRLAAIAGLAKEFQRQTTISYKAGIWLDHCGLLWAVNGRGRMPTKYKAPSWSWAALDTNFYLGLDINPYFQVYAQTSWIEDKEDDFEAEILSCDVQTVNGDPFGEVISGQLRLRGYMLLLSKWRGTAPPYINTFRRPVVYHQRILTSTSKDGGIRWPMAADQLVLDFDKIFNNDERSNDEESNVSNELESEEPDEEGKIDAGVRLDDYPSGLILFQIKSLVTSGNPYERTAMSLCLLLAPQEQGRSEFEYCRVGTAQAPNINGLGRDSWVQREISIF
jgi:hypothetical protein